MIGKQKVQVLMLLNFKKETSMKFLPRSIFPKKRQSMGKDPTGSKKGLEFQEKEYLEIDRYCKEIGITWFASAWDIKSLNFLDKFNLEYNKVASAMIVDINFITEVAKETNTHL